MQVEIRFTQWRWDKGQAVTSESEAFWKLMHAQMTAYLGQGPHENKTASPQAQPPQQQYQPHHQSMPMPAMMYEFARQYEELKKEKVKKEEGSVVMTEFMLAALKEFAGIATEGQFPIFYAYALLKQTKDEGDRRQSGVDNWTQ